MTILETDIKLMAAERMTDTDDGGGRETANEIVDGVSNNLFPDISRLDRVYGTGEPAQGVRERADPTARTPTTAPTPS